MTRQDILDFLDSYEKARSLRSIAQMDWSPIVENIPQLKRKETSIYKPSDMWTTQDYKL